jgi:hypothetical protein
MKTGILGVMVVTLLLAGTGVRAEDGIGIGAIMGEPTGITVKKWISHDHAIDAAAGWSFSENDSFQFHADYLIHNFAILDPGTIGGRLPVYVGVGGRLKLANHDHADGRNHDDALLGVRVPFGVSYLFAKAPVELFAEIVPILDLAPRTEFDLNGAVGARFYFK